MHPAFWPAVRWFLGTLLPTTPGYLVSDHPEQIDLHRSQPRMAHRFLLKHFLQNK